MTAREQQVLAFIEGYLAKSGGVAPSLDEITTGIGIKSKSVTHAILASLEAHGFIKREPYRARKMTVLRGAGSHCMTCGRAYPATGGGNA